MLTAAELAGRVWPQQIVPPPGLDVAPVPHPVLADGEVRYVGQPVAAVVAEPRGAEDLAEQVEVEYEPLEAIATRGRASRSCAGRSGRGTSRVRSRAPRSRAHGDRDPAPGRGADGAARRARGARRGPADVLHVVAERAPAARAARAEPRARRGEHPRDRAGRRRRVRLQGHAAGRGAARRARRARTQRPVKWAEDRRENFLAAPQGRGMRAAVELAFDAEGRILALRGRLLADLGAYLLPSTPIPPHTTAMLLAGCYDIQNVEVIVTGARTNKVPTAPYRGAGRPEASYLIETALDAAARQLRHRPGRAAPPQPDPRVPLQDRVRLDVRLGRLRGLPGPRAGAARRRAAGARARARHVVRRVRGRPRARAHRHRRRALAWSAPAACSSTPRSPATATTSPSRSARSPPARATTRCSRRSPPTGSASTRSASRCVTGDTDALAEGVGSFASRSTAMGGSAVAAAATTCSRNGTDTGRARFASEQVFASGAYAATVEVDPATGARRVTRWSPSTTPAGSSTRCSPRAR